MSAATQPQVRVLVAAGGTAGHLAPALAVADVLRADGAHVQFAVSAGRADESIVRSRGYHVEAFPIGGLPRKLGIAQVRALWQALVAVPRCVRILRRARAHVVLAGGGYVSVPAALAGWLLRVPVVVTEADAYLGLANRISTRVARTLCSAYPLRTRRDRQVVTGRPVDPAFVDPAQPAARAQLAIPQEAMVLLVFGGSGGALHLSEAVFEAFGSDDDPRAGGRELWILHVAGRRDFPQLERQGAASERYRLIEYSDQMPALVAAADLVISRAGGSVFEIAAAGRAAVLVPSPFVTADHQTLNARHFERGGGAVVVPHGQFDAARVRGLVEELLGPQGDGPRAQLASRIRELARPDAAADIAAEVVRAAQQRHVPPSRPGRIEA